MEKIRMKKISLVVAGLATIGVFGFGQSVHAEETTASVLVKSGGIKISDTKNITFNDVTVKKVEQQRQKKINQVLPLKIYVVQVVKGGH